MSYSAEKINMYHAKDISMETATRDLREATENGILVKNGDGRMTVYFLRKSRRGQFNLLPCYQP